MLLTLMLQRKVQPGNEHVETLATEPRGGDLAHDDLIWKKLLGDAVHFRKRCSVPTLFTSGGSVIDIPSMMRRGILHGDYDGVSHI